MLLLFFPSAAPHHCPVHSHWLWYHHFMLRNVILTLNTSIDSTLLFVLRFSPSLSSSAFSSLPSLSFSPHTVNLFACIRCRRITRRRKYDFLNDPTRSVAFSVNTPAFQIKKFDHLIQEHHRYASSYAIDGSSICFPALCLLPYLLFQSLCWHRVSSATLPYSLGHKEPNLSTSISSWHPSATSWCAYPLICCPSLNLLTMLIFCDSWQNLITASLG